VPRLSHQFPVAVVVVTVVVPVGGMVYIGVDDDVVIGVDDDVSVEVELEVVDAEQDANNIAATNKKLKPNQINLFFNFSLLSK